MKNLLVALALLVGVTGFVDEAQAKGRLGGGRSLGAQRQMTPPQRQAAPSQQQATPPAAGSRWLGPLAGLAAGLGLGWLFGQGGFGAMLGIVMLALVAGFVVMVLLRALGRGPTERQPMRYAGLGGETVTTPPGSQSSYESVARPSGANAMAPAIPAGFDVEGFLGQAQHNFVVLQEANDRGDLDALREVTTEEMFDALKGEVLARSADKQQTDVVTLNAALLEVVTEGAKHWASVRFSGTIREDVNALPVPFQEVWHLQKPVDGSTGWLLAGIQQVS
jgi:predicted lipid-binding transport protein (Tim44 family)